MSGKVYKFRFLGSVTECAPRRSYEEPHKELDEPKPFILEFKIAAYSQEGAERKLARYIAWNFEKGPMSNFDDR